MYSSWERVNILQKPWEKAVRKEWEKSLLPLPKKTEEVKEWKNPQILQC
jgi:hypothetical protein